MINFASNATGWNPAEHRLVPGGQVDRLIAPVLAHLPNGSYTVSRQPTDGAVNVYLSNRDRYVDRSHRADRVGVSYAHGLASKGYRDWTRTKRFDYVTVPGPAHAREVIASGAPAHRVIEIGYPKLDPLFRGEITGPPRDERIRVLWAPTHGGGSEEFIHGNRSAVGAAASSWWHRDEIMRHLDPDTFDTVACPHPRHAPGRRATYEEYATADVVIADGGSTIYEAMALGMPVVLPAWLTRARNLSREGGRLLEATVYREELGLHVHDPRDLADTVVRAAEEGPGPREREFIDQVLPPQYRGTSGQRFAAWLLDLDEKGTR